MNAALTVPKQATKLAELDDLVASIIGKDLENFPVADCLCSMGYQDTSTQIIMKDCDPSRFLIAPLTAPVTALSTAHGTCGPISPTNS